jgi:hypothetical protein
MRHSRLFAVAALAAGLAGATLTGASADEDTPPLTCTFVHGQCLVECGKEARETVCLHYCNGRRNSCMFTGRWTGRFGDMFPIVLKE